MSVEMRAMPSIIPAIRDIDAWNLLPAPGPVSWVFLLGGTIDAIAEPVALLQHRGWTVFVHIDMLRGLTSDVDALKFLRNYAGPDGVISTHSQTVGQAKRLGFITIQRIFLLDSQSLATGIAQIRNARPHAVEVLPGLIPTILNQVTRQLPCPVIAGGLVKEREQVVKLLDAGVRSVSTSAPNLWGEKF